MGSTSIVAAHCSAIRTARSEDIDRIIELVWANVEEGPYKSKIEFDGNMLRLFVGQLLADNEARVIVYEHSGIIQGVFAFTTFPNFYYFAGKRMASMVVWSVAKRFRGRVSIQLLRAGQNEARNIGAYYMVLTGPTKEFGALCKHCDYDFLESSYIKEL